MHIKFFSAVPEEDKTGIEEQFNKAKMNFNDYKARYFPAAETVLKEHKKLSPHLKRLTAVYSNLEPPAQKKLGASGAVIAAGATAVGLGLRLNRATLDEIVEE